MPDMSVSKKWDIFVSCLKSKTQFEVRKSSCAVFEEATKIAMRVEAAFANVSIEHQSSGSESVAVPHGLLDPMEIDNTEIGRTERSKQRLIATCNNPCFKCHEVGCHPWKRGEDAVRSVPVSNVETALVAVYDDDRSDRFEY